MSIRDALLMVLVAFLWAICFPLIEVGLGDAPPLVFAATRAVLAGALLILLAVWLGRPWPRGFVNLGLIAAIGVSFTGLGFGGMFLGGGKISPGLATVLANIQPLIAAVLAVIFLSERLTPRIGTGLLLGFIGVVVMSLPSLSGSEHAAGMQAFLWITLGAVGTAVGNVLLKALAGRADVLMVTGLQLLIGALALAVGAQAVGEDWSVDWTSRFVASLVGLAVFGTALMTALWYHLLQRASLNRLNTFTFLTPVFGLLLGGLFFDERLDSIQLIGILVTILGIQRVATRPSPTKERVL
ncbi:DMT family transporter [Salinisphaera sp. P385]|uniref:DMT family transporter n=1 Tax=Spectribacter acetivorans TaxID=3075603 RepID=A0ABU3BDC5_9GAMM|nr:DMT family transporter [Salinisphaera sp. P385]MDT0619832.1 DMT family transporter [Salinisphaera sp. P385]